MSYGLKHLPYKARVSNQIIPFGIRLLGLRTYLIHGYKFQQDVAYLRSNVSLFLSISLLVYSIQVLNLKRNSESEHAIYPVEQFRRIFTNFLPPFVKYSSV